MFPNQSNLGCACTAALKLIFSCSGAADVGASADQAARKLIHEGAGKMFCLAGIGGRVSGIMKSTEAAESILVIDGCALDCTKKSLEEAGFTKFNHLRLTDLGFEKGKTEVGEFKHLPWSVRWQKAFCEKELEAEETIASSPVA